jgi:hypothetical protein
MAHHQRSLFFVLIMLISYHSQCVHRFFSILLCLGGNLGLFCTFQPMYLHHWLICGNYAFLIYNVLFY